MNTRVCKVRGCPLPCAGNLSKRVCIQPTDELVGRVDGHNDAGAALPHPRSPHRAANVELLVLCCTLWSSVIVYSTALLCSIAVCSIAQDAFNGAAAFNQPLNRWDVSSVTSFQVSSRFWPRQLVPGNAALKRLRSAHFFPPLGHPFGSSVRSACFPVRLHSTGI